MYFCDEGIVLRQRTFRDNDRISTILTRNNGKLEVVFKSVKKSKAKLRALSESFTYSDYRFYLAKKSTFSVCTGGKIISAFNRIRLSEEKLFSAFYLAELMLSLTPLDKPSPEKFELIYNAFKYLENNSHIPKLFFIAYALILIEYCGIGFKKNNPGVDSEVWEKIHDPLFGWLEYAEGRLKYSDFLMISNLALGKIREHTLKDISSLKFVKIL